MHSIFERFTHPGTMMDAEMELVAKGEAAIAELEAFFSGAAKNRYGVAYRKLGLPVDCAIHVAARLGPLAKPLEQYLQEVLLAGNHYAAMALRNIGELAPESIEALALSLDSDDCDMAFEAAMTLLEGDHLEHPAVVYVISHSTRAEKAVTQMKKFQSTGFYRSRRKK